MDHQPLSAANFPLADGNLSIILIQAEEPNIGRILDHVMTAQPQDIRRCIAQLLFLVRSTGTVMRENQRGLGQCSGEQRALGQANSDTLSSASSQESISTLGDLPGNPPAVEERIAPVMENVPAPPVVIPNQVEAIPAIIPEPEILAQPEAQEVIQPPPPIHREVALVNQVVECNQRNWFEQNIVDPIISLNNIQQRVFIEEPPQLLAIYEHNQHIANAPDDVARQVNVEYHLSKNALKDQYRYSGPKLVREDLNPYPKAPVFVKTQHTQDANIDWLKYLQRKQKSIAQPFCDADLVAYLRLHTFCEVKSKTLIRSMRIRAIRFMSEFDCTNYSLNDIYTIIGSSIAEALQPSEVELLCRTRCAEGSNALEDMQPFFQEGLYKKSNWFSRGKTLGQSS